MSDLTVLDVERRVNKLMNLALEHGTVDEKSDPSRVQRLRVSSFPFCGVRWFMDLPSGTGSVKSGGTKFKFYMSVGHAVHDTMQRVLASMDFEEQSAEFLNFFV